MRLLLAATCFLFVHAITVSAEVCDDNYYTNSVVLVTMQGSDVQDLQVVSVDTLGLAYNDMPALNGVDYNFISQFTSHCDEYGEQPITFSYRGKDDDTFQDSSASRYSVFAPTIQVGEEAWENAFLFKRDSVSSTLSEYVFYDSTLMHAEGTFGAALVSDTIKSSTGTIQGISLSSHGMAITRDSADYLTFLRSAFGEPLADTVTRSMTVQLLSVFYRNTRPLSDEASLVSLTLSQGDLEPEFSSNTFTYTSQVDNPTASITVTPTTSDSNASLEMNGTPLESGEASVPLELAEGENILVITVIAEDGETTQAYTITITRVPNTLTLLSPNGGEVLTQGSVQDILWNSTGSISQVKLEYRYDGEGWHTIVNPTDNDGSHTWTVPDHISDSVLVRLSTLDNAVSDSVDDLFSIGTPPSITVTAPEAGQEWQAGKDQRITWTSSNGLGALKIDYRLEGTWAEITSETPNDGSFNWSIPPEISGPVRVRIRTLDETVKGTVDFQVEKSSGLLAYPEQGKGTLSMQGVGLVCTFPQSVTHITLFDAKGNLVVRIPVSSPRILWDGMDAKGEYVQAGAYIIQLASPEQTVQVKRLHLR